MKTDMNFTRCDTCGAVVAESLADCWNCRRNMAHARSEALTREWQGKDAPKANQPLSLREQAAIAAMQGMLADCDRSGRPEYYARNAVLHADALITELNKEVAK